jgi:hypothetical protein
MAGQASSLVPHGRPSLPTLDAHTFIDRRPTARSCSPAFPNLADDPARLPGNDRATRPHRVRRKHRAIQNLDIVLDHDHVADRAVRPNPHVAPDLGGADVRVGSDVDVVGDAEHEVRYRLLGFAAVGIGHGRESRGRVQCAAGADEHVAAQVDGGLVLGCWCRFLVALRLLLRWGFGLRWPHQVTVDHDVLLDHAFAGKDDVPRTQDTRAAADLVARFGLDVFASYRGLGWHVVLNMSSCRIVLGGNILWVEKKHVHDS